MCIIYNEYNFKMESVHKTQSYIFNWSYLQASNNIYVEPSNFPDFFISLAHWAMNIYIYLDNNYEH